VYELLGTLPTAEAVDADPGPDPAAAPRVLLRDEHFVHAAYRPVGLGRVVFTSFPASALAPNDERAISLWRALLDSGDPAADWSATALSNPDDRDELLESMIGVPTAPWSLAAAVAGGFVALVALLHLAMGGTRRPAAFAVVVGLAVIASAALLGLASARQGGQELAGARLATMDLAATGGGMFRQLTTYLGRDDDGFSVAAADPAVALRPVVSSSPVVLTLEPFAAPDAGVHAARIERVWEAVRPVSGDVRLDAAMAFGPDGPTLTVGNPFDAPLAGPVLVWGNVFRLGQPELPPGESSIRQMERNARGDFANVSVIASEVDKLRGEILRAAESPASDVLARATEPAPHLAAWMDESAAPRLLTTDPGEPRMRGHVLVRAPLRIEPSPVGSRVRVPRGFTRLTLGQSRGLPFNLATQEFIANAQTGQWGFALAAPPQVGALRPARVTLAADAAAPAHTITFLKGQVRDGKPRENPAASGADVVATWVNPIGQQTVTFEVGPDDADAFGRVWLLMRVEKTDAADLGNLTQWHLRELDLAYDDAEVVGPPPPPAELTPPAPPARGSDREEGE
jgi:hypothetical protein